MAELASAGAELVMVSVLSSAAAALPEPLQLVLLCCGASEAAWAILLCAGVHPQLCCSPVQHTSWSAGCGSCA